MSEIYSTEAEQRAEELDTILQTTGRTVGPLHGLPVSLKGRFHFKGLDSLCCYVSWIGEAKSEEDKGILVKRLRNAGAVIFVKASVPMSTDLMSLT